VTTVKQSCESDPSNVVEALIPQPWSAAYEKRFLLRQLMNLRHLLCRVSAVLGIHEPVCDHCNVLQECWGIDMRKRLEELAQQEQVSKDNGARGQTRLGD